MHRPARAAAALLVLLALAACGGDDEQAHGGAEGLPGPVPAGVEFAEPDGEGVPAPDFTAELVDGTRVTASELWDDRPIVLVFTASWCEACKEVHRQVAEAVAEHDGAIGLLAVVPADDAEGARAYAEELELEHAVAVAGDDVWLDFAAREPPLVVLVGPGGAVLRGWPGGPGEGLLAEQLDALVAVEPGQGR
jgi:thiol-disulfide isomerase/thioredoxin